MAEILIPVIEADIQLIARYVYAPGARLEIPITALRGTHDDEVSWADLAGWAGETSAGFTQRDVDSADHLFSGESWLALAGEVRRSLAQPSTNAASAATVG
jgi:surfactin synthase thioesterase subunit